MVSLGSHFHGCIVVALLKQATVRLVEASEFSDEGSEGLNGDLEIVIVSLKTDWPWQHLKHQLYCNFFFYSFE